MCVVWCRCGRSVYVWCVVQVWQKCVWCGAGVTEVCVVWCSVREVCVVWCRCGRSVCGVMQVWQKCVCVLQVWQKCVCVVWFRCGRSVCGVVQVWQKQSSSEQQQQAPLSVCQLGSTIGRMWRELPDNVKLKYNTDYNAEKVPVI